MKFNLNIWKSRSLFFTFFVVFLLITESVSAAIYELQDFQFTYGGSTIFSDDFSDNIIPQIPPYSEVQGASGMSEANGILTMDTDFAPIMLGGTIQADFYSGGAGSIDAIFTDMVPPDNHSAGIEIGNLGLGGVEFFVGSNSSGTFIQVTTFAAGSTSDDIILVEEMPISGFTGVGTLTLNFLLSDSNQTDGLFEITPQYWFNSDPIVTLSDIQLPLEIPNNTGYPAYYSFGAAETIVPIPGAVYLFGSGLIVLLGIGKSLGQRPIG